MEQISRIYFHKFHLLSATLKARYIINVCILFSEYHLNVMPNRKLN